MVSQRTPAGVGDWDLTMSEGKDGGEYFCEPLEIRAGRQGRPRQVSCYRAGDETKGLDLEERRRGEDRKLACLFLWTE